MALSALNRAVSMKPRHPRSVIKYGRGRASGAVCIHRPGRRLAVVGRGLTAWLCGWSLRSGGALVPTLKERLEWRLPYLTGYRQHLRWRDAWEDLGVWPALLVDESDNRQGDRQLNEPPSTELVHSHTSTAGDLRRLLRSRHLERQHLHTLGLDSLSVGRGADDGSMLYYQQQVLGTISRTSLGI